MDKKVPNDFEAIRASGNQQARFTNNLPQSHRYMANFTANKNYTNQYISMLNINRPNKEQHRDRTADLQCHSALAHMPNDSDQQSLVAGNSEQTMQQLKVSHSAYMTNPTIDKMDYETQELRKVVENAQGPHQGKGQNNRKKDWDDLRLLSEEDIHDLNDETNRQRPLTLRSGLNNDKSESNRQHNLKEANRIADQFAESQPIKTTHRSVAKQHNRPDQPQKEKINLSEFQTGGVSLSAYTVKSKPSLSMPFTIKEEDVQACVDRLKQVDDSPNDNADQNEFRIKNIQGVSREMLNIQGRKDQGKTSEMRSVRSHFTHISENTASRDQTGSQNAQMIKQLQNKWEQKLRLIQKQVEIQTAELIEVIKPFERTKDETIATELQANRINQVRQMANSPNPIINSVVYAPKQNGGVRSLTAIGGETKTNQYMKQIISPVDITAGVLEELSPDHPTKSTQQYPWQEVEASQFTPLPASTQREKINSDKMADKRSHTPKSGNITSQRGFTGMLSSNLQANLADFEFQKVRANILSGELTNVVVHPQDMKRLGLLSQPTSAVQKKYKQLGQPTTQNRKLPSHTLSLGHLDSSPVQSKKSAIYENSQNEQPESLKWSKSTKGLKSMKTSKSKGSGNLKADGKSGPYCNEPSAKSEIRKTKTTRQSLEILDQKQVTSKNCKSPKPVRQQTTCSNLEAESDRENQAAQEMGQSKRQLGMKHVNNFMHQRRTSVGNSKEEVKKSRQYKNQGLNQYMSIQSIGLDLDEDDKKENAFMDEVMTRVKELQSLIAPDSERQEERQGNDIDIPIDTQESEMIKRKVQSMQILDEQTIQEKEDLLEFLIHQEAQLFKFTVDNFEGVQAIENQKREADRAIQDYKDILQKVGINKLRIMFFVRQMQITFIIARSYVRVFTNSLQKRFQVKLQHIFLNLHQNLLLMIDIVLKTLNQQIQAPLIFNETQKDEVYDHQERGLNLAQTSDNYRLLKQITETKLRTKEKQSKMLTCFRQNNEVNIQNLKKINKYLLDSYSPESIGIKVLANEVVEVMKLHLNNVIANLNSISFDLHTSLPTSQIEFINRQISRRADQVINAFSIPQTVENLAAKKRNKSNIKGSASPDKIVQSKIAGIVHRNNSSGVDNQKSIMSDAENRPATIGDLITAANQGQKSGVLAGRKSTKRASKQPSFISINEALGSPKDMDKLSKSFINSDTKRCGSSNLIFGERPGSPVLVKEENGKMIMRNKYPGVTTKIVQQDNGKQQSNSVLDSANQNMVKRLTVPTPSQAKRVSPKKEQIPIKRKDDFNTPLKTGAAQKKISSSSQKQSTLRGSEQKSNLTDKKIKSNMTSAKKSTFIMNRPSQILATNNHFNLPETLAFIQDQMQQNQSYSVVNNNINIYGPGGLKILLDKQTHITAAITPHGCNCRQEGASEHNHSYNQPELISTDTNYQDQTSLYQPQTSFFDQPIQNAESEDEQQEFNLLEQMRNNRPSMPLIKRNQIQSKKQPDDILSNAPSRPSLQPSTLPKQDTVSSKKEFTSMLKPPSRQKNVSPRQLENAISPQKMTRGKSGIGSGIRNLQNVQERIKNQGNDILKNFTSQHSLESEQPPEPHSLIKINPIHQEREHLELDEFERIEASIRSSQKIKQNLSYDLDQSPGISKASFLDPENTETFSPIKAAENRNEVTEPRRFKKKSGQSDFMLDDKNQYTNPRARKLHKSMFLGEYDATEEEESIMRSQNRARKTMGSPDDVSNISKFIQNHQSNESLLPSQRLIRLQNVPDKHVTESEIARNIEGLLDTPANDPSEINIDRIEVTTANNSAKKSLEQIISSYRQEPLNVIQQHSVGENNENHRENEDEYSSNKPMERPSLTNIPRHQFEDQPSVQVPFQSKVRQLASQNGLVQPHQVREDDQSVEQLSEVFEDEDIKEQTLTIVPHQEEEPIHLRESSQVDFYEANSKDQNDMSEQDQIDLEYRQLREQVTYPYLPPLNKVKKLPKYAKNISEVYTLVLDLDETLIHFEIDDNADDDDDGYYNIRPGALRFLSVLSEFFEIVVFTAAMPDYADWILDDIDRANKISHRLYRQHTTPHEDYAIKDLKNLGRDLSRTIIIDNLAENFIYTTPLNGIWVESWYDDMDDNVLGLLIPFLKQIVEFKVDVRTLLTEHIKHNYIYRLLDEQRSLPHVTHLVDLSEEQLEFERQHKEEGQD